MSGANASPTGRSHIGDDRSIDVRVESTIRCRWTFKDTNRRLMNGDQEEFKVGDSVLVVGAEHDGELGTIIGISVDGQRYLVVFEDGKQAVLVAGNLSHRW